MLKLGEKLTYETGRTYDSKQILECEIIGIEKQLNEIVYNIKVIDNSRIMKIYIQSTEFTGEKILALYDAGLYHNHIGVIKTNWDLSFISNEETYEGCPICACETKITCDGKSSCSECGHKEVLTCSECSTYNNYELCDWNKETRCTPFPKVSTSRTN